MPRCPCFPGTYGVVYKARHNRSHQIVAYVFASKEREREGVDAPDRAAALAITASRKFDWKQKMKVFHPRPFGKSAC